MKTLKDLKEKALQNIEEDRKKATEIIDSIVLEISAQKGTYSFHAQSFAKLIETMQRSNEQLVKILSLEKDKEPPAAATSLKDGDLDLLYEELASDDAALKKKKGR